VTALLYSIYFIVSLDALLVDVGRVWPYHIKLSSSWLCILSCMLEVGYPSHGVLRSSVGFLIPIKCYQSLDNVPKIGYTRWSSLCRV